MANPILELAVWEGYFRGNHTSHIKQRVGEMQADTLARLLEQIGSRSRTSRAVLIRYFINRNKQAAVRKRLGVQE